MGICAIGVSFGVPVALGGVLLHVMAHAAAKGNAFMGAGVFTVKYGTKDMAGIRDGMRLLPWSGPLFLLAVFALSALPPSGIFRSEFQIVVGGLGSGGYAAAAVLVVLVTLVFFGLATAATSMLLNPRGDGPPGDPPAWGDSPSPQAPLAPAHGGAARPLVPPGEPSAWMVVPVLAGGAVLLLLGLHPPGELTDLISRATALLGTS